ncbi:MAG: ATP-grasp ribosomal peptide maturase [Pseudonocardia sp.]
MIGRRPSVLVVTGSDDPTADAVIDELHKRRTTVHRFDLGDFPIDTRMDAVHDGQRWRGTLRTCNGALVDLDTITSIYYRRPSRFTFPVEMSPTDRAFADEEARIGVGGVLAALDALWVSHPHDVARAEWKPLQIQTAAEVGLAVPRTLIGNSYPAAQRFIASAAGPVVCKSMSSIVFAEGDGYKIPYTTVVDQTSITEPEFEASAHLLQEWVPKAREARVTMVGEQALAVAIDADSDRARVDWRADYDNLRYEPITVPDDVVAKMGDYLAVFRLPFGAFDFVITADGRWVMLECNPNGQWLWLHHRAGLPIPAVIADLLASTTTEGANP